MGGHVPDVAEIPCLFGNEPNERMVDGQPLLGPVEIAHLVHRADPQPAVGPEGQPVHLVAPGDRILAPPLPVEAEHLLASEIEHPVLVLHGDPARVRAACVPGRVARDDRTALLSAARKGVHQGSEGQESNQDAHVLGFHTLGRLQ